MVLGTSGRRQGKQPASRTLCRTRVLEFSHLRDEEAGAVFPPTPTNIGEDCWGHSPELRVHWVRPEKASGEGTMLAVTGVVGRRKGKCPGDTSGVLHGSARAAVTKYRSPRSPGA